MHQALASAPAHLPALGLALIGAFTLGVLHGVTPDEHTWPVTLSYAMGSSSARRGLRSALAFALAFTLHRAVLSELAYLGLTVVGGSALWDAGVYVLVGAVMSGAAIYMLRPRYRLQLRLWPPRVALGAREGHPAHHDVRAPTPAMAAVHGFVAGFGFDAFVPILATVLAPAMPSAALGWLPGALFGLGTALVLACAGALIGAFVRRRRLSEAATRALAQHAAGRTLLIGGASFLAVGLACMLDPAVMSAGVATGIHVYNLDQVNVGTVLVAGVVIVALATMARSLRALRGGLGLPAAVEQATTVQSELVEAA